MKKKDSYLKKNIVNERRKKVWRFIKFKIQKHWLEALGYTFSSLSILLGILKNKAMLIRLGVAIFGGIYLKSELKKDDERDTIPIEKGLNMEKKVEKEDTTLKKWKRSQIEVMQRNKRNLDNSLNDTEYLRDLFRIKMNYYAFEYGVSININDEQWDKYFYLVYGLFEEYSLVNSFDVIFDKVIKLIVADVIASNRNVLSTMDLIYGLKYLRTPNSSFDNKTIKLLISKAEVELNYQKVVNLNDVRSRHI